MSYLFRFLFVGFIVSQLSACLGVIAVGAGTGASAASDPRTLGTQVDDETIENRALANIRTRSDISTQSHIEVVSYDHIVLVLGQTPNEGYRRDIGDLVARDPAVHRVVNEVKVGSPRGIMSGLGDTTITAKIKTSMITESGFPSGKVKVVTEDGTAYLFGVVTKEQGNKAIELARQINGVTRVVELFEYVEG